MFRLNCDCMLTEYKEDCMLTACREHDVLYARIAARIYTVSVGTVNMKSNAKIAERVQ